MGGNFCAAIRRSSTEETQPATLQFLSYMEFVSSCFQYLSVHEGSLSQSSASSAIVKKIKEVIIKHSR